MTVGLYRHQEVGFTLVESMVVISLLGLLAVFLSRGYVEQRAQGQIDAATRQGQLLVNLADYYRQSLQSIAPDNYQYPNVSEQALVSNALFDRKIMTGGMDVNYVYTVEPHKVHVQMVLPDVPDGSYMVMLYPQNISGASYYQTLMAKRFVRLTSDREVR